MLRHVSDLAKRRIRTARVPNAVEHSKARVFSAEPFHVLRWLRTVNLDDPSPFLFYADCARLLLNQSKTLAASVDRRHCRPGPQRSSGTYTDRDLTD